LQTVLSKPIGEGTDYAESWEIADHEQGQSVVANGPLAGTTLHELVISRGQELFGRHAPQPRFPLLFKFLDCQRDLSVQVHPDDAAAALLTPPDLGKTEAWVILDAQPGSRIYAGLRRGVNRDALAAAVHEGRTEECLHSFDARAGQCVFIPAGTVHALGAGLLVAEIQQASDTTYRLFDWNRVGPDGKPRKLHIDEALDAIDYTAVEVVPVQPSHTSVPDVERLVSCDKFMLSRWAIQQRESIGGDDRCHIVTALQGVVHIEPAGIAINKGQTVLLPACLPESTLIPQGSAILLDMYLPGRSCFA